MYGLASIVPSLLIELTFDFFLLLLKLVLIEKLSLSKVQFWRVSWDQLNEDLGLGTLISGTSAHGSSAECSGAKPKSDDVRSSTCTGYPQIGKQLPSCTTNQFADWEIIGTMFQKRNELTRIDLSELQSGDTILHPTILHENLLWGSVFRLVHGVSPESLAAIFADYDHHCRFVPGMPITRVLRRDGSMSRVLHRINPLIFLIENVAQILPRWLYEFLTYSYQLDEQVSIVPGKDAAFAIRWTIPLETQVLGARENGQILLSSAPGGTLISYNNATEPFLGHLAREFEALNALLMPLADSYYVRTVDGLVDFFHNLRPDEVKVATNNLWAQI
jgi:hypothetical protein